MSRAPARRAPRPRRMIGPVAWFERRSCLARQASWVWMPWTRNAACQQEMPARSAPKPSLARQARPGRQQASPACLVVARWARMPRHAAALGDEVNVAVARAVFGRVGSARRRGRARGHNHVRHRVGLPGRSGGAGGFAIMDAVRDHAGDRALWLARQGGRLRRIVGIAVRQRVPCDRAHGRVNSQAQLQPLPFRPAVLFGLPRALLQTAPARRCPRPGAPAHCPRARGPAGRQRPGHGGKGWRGRGRALKAEQAQHAGRKACRLTQEGGRRAGTSAPARLPGRRRRAVRRACCAAAHATRPGPLRPARMSGRRAVVTQLHMPASSRRGSAPSGWGDGGRRCA